MAYVLFNDIFNAISNAGLALGLGLTGAFLVLLAGMVIALIRVHSRGIDEWVFVLFMYSIQPKRYLWHFNKLDDFELLELYKLVKGVQKIAEKEEETEW
jgi:hypothetical protein